MSVFGSNVATSSSAIWFVSNGYYAKKTNGLTDWFGSADAFVSVLRFIVFRLSAFTANVGHTNVPLFANFFRLKNVLSIIE